jgi:hypothetical protein
VNPAKFEYQREMLETWLVTYGEHVSTREPGHPDEHHDRSGKRGSRAPQDVRWLEMVSDPDVQRTHAFLKAAVFRDLPEEDGEAFAAMWDAYLGPFSDVSLPGYWLRRGRTEDLARWHALERAISFVIGEAEKKRILLVVPDPEQAQDWVTQKRRQRIVARRTYFQLRGEGAKPGRAVREAVKASGASRRAIYYWVRQTRNRGKPKPQV